VILRIAIFAIVIGAIGLVFGYVVFGKIGGEYITIKQVFQTAENVIEDIAGTITGLEDARRNIWISGAVGAGIGLIVGALVGRQRA
jgi:hypothetical protein